jgi:spermidine synthase
MPIEIPWWKKVFSFFKPMYLQQVHSMYTQNVQLLLHNNQLMLATPNAMYSYGTKYAPFRLSFAHLHQRHLLQPKHILMLGGALLSALQILDQTYSIRPTVTVVEIDGKYQQLVMDYLPEKITKTIQYHHCNAQEFVGNCKQVFDMVCVDIFIDMQVPDFVMEASFLHQCKQLLSDKGILIINTHFAIEAEMNVFKKKMDALFENIHQIKYINNYVFVARLS